MKEAPIMKPDTPELMPCAIDAEEAIISAILFDPLAIHRIDSLLKAEHFYNSTHEKIYKCALALAEDGRTVDMISVSQMLADSDDLDGIGGKAAIANIMSASVSSANIDQYAALVVDKAKRRNLIRYGHSMVTLGYETTKPVADVMDSAESALFEVTQGTTPDKPKHVADTMTRLVERLSQPPTDISGIASGYYDLDAMTQGFQRSDLILAAARPAMGKSALFEQITHFVAGNTGLPCLFFSLEMTDEQLGFRTVSREARIDSGRLRNRQIAQSEWQVLSDVTNRISRRPVFVKDDFGTTVAEMRSHSRQLMAEHGQLGLIVIDYLQLMEGQGDNRVQALAKITRALKGLAKELNVPIVALSQLSRNVEQRTNKRPIMSDIRESGAIEQDCDVIMMLYRDEYYDPETADRGIAEINIVKHRNGPTGTVKLLFEPEFTNFLNKAREPENDQFAPKTSMRGGM